MKRDSRRPPLLSARRVPYLAGEFFPGDLPVLLNTAPESAQRHERGDRHDRGHGGQDVVRGVGEVGPDESGDGSGVPGRWGR